MIPKTMRAVVLTGPTPAEDVRLTEVPVPAARPGWWRRTRHCWTRGRWRAGCPA